MDRHQLYIIKKPCATQQSGRNKNNDMDMDLYSEKTGIQLLYNPQECPWDGRNIRKNHKILFEKDADCDTQLMSFDSF